ncbi:MAG: hypothetical protein R3C53_12405 [Pirellulaceae bacterium]
MIARILTTMSLVAWTQFGALAQQPFSPSAGSVPRAVAGEPFGVFTAEIPLPPGFNTSQTPRVLVEDTDGRIFYPVVKVRFVEVVEEVPEPPRIIGRPGGLIDRVRSAIRGESKKRQVPVSIEVAALFRGTKPLTVNLVGDVTMRVPIAPQVYSEATHRKLAVDWWNDYTDAAKQAVSGNDAPSLIHKYLTTMLADRMQLPRVDLDPPAAEDKAKSELDQPLQTLSLLAAIEPLRDQILEDVINHPGDLSGDELPLPPEPNWQPTVLPPIGDDVPIEALAGRVPPECFYLRFGSFANYVWFQEIAERYGGDIGQAVLLRGFNYEASARMERMLASKMTAIGKMFGDKLIGDMAIVGSDLYMKEGASLGVVFYATNPKLLKAAFDSDRRAVISKTPGASLQEIEIAGKPVSLLSTPDNRVRSFQVIDGDYIFVTTSSTLARRFIEVGLGQPSLASTPAFRWARTWMPDANDYSVFGYFSPEFFHRLVSPQYQIELRRRLEAIAHLEVAEVASQTALAEGAKADDIEALQRAELLPPWFDVRPDAARILRSGERWIDSARGARGSFLPIADVEIKSVTEREAQGYAQISSYYQDQWQRMDPMLVGLRRFRVEPKPGFTTAPGAFREQVAFEGYIAPFEAEKYGWIARQLAQPSPVEIQLPADDAVSVQLHMRGNSGLLAAPDDYHLFAGVKDMLPPAPEDTQGLIKTLRALRAAPAYLGAWPKPGLIEKLPLGLGLARPDYAGFSRMLGGLWRWQDQEFSLLSFDRSILDQAIPQLGVRQSTDLAQARAQVADLSGSQLSKWINQIWYERGLRASRANTLFLDHVHQQLKVPGNDCLDVAQRLLDVKLQCPLGGDFVFTALPVATGGSTTGGWWQCTATQNVTYSERGKPLPPPDYSAPWIDWFRGGKLHLTQQPDSLAVVGSFELEMQPLRVQIDPNQEPASSLLPPMNFDLFNLPLKLFGQDGQQPQEKIERKKF